MAVSKRTRYEVLKRDNFTCRYCRSAENPLKVDHVTPVALGGGDDPSNLVAACQDCNSGKASTAPDAATVADVAQDALRWAAAIAAHNAAQLGDRRKRDAYTKRFSKAWNSWKYGPEDGKRTMPLPPDWQPTIWRFYGLGLPAAEVEDAVVIAAGNQMVPVDKVFKYMCGVLWNKVNAMQEGAKSHFGAA